MGLDSTLFRYSLVNEEVDGGAESDFDSVSFGAGIPNAGLNFGGTVLNGLVLGGRVNVGRYGQDQLLEDYSLVIWSVLPYLEYVFLDGVFRPFVTVIAGVEGVADYLNDDTWWWGFNVSGGGGFHFFVHQHISIDFSLLAGFVIGSGERNNQDFQHRRFTMSCLFGVSGWF